LIVNINNHFATPNAVDTGKKKFIPFSIGGRDSPTVSNHGGNVRLERYVIQPSTVFSHIS